MKLKEKLDLKVELVNEEQSLYSIDAAYWLATYIVEPQSWKWNLLYIINDLLCQMVCQNSEHLKWELWHFTVYAYINLINTHKVLWNDHTHLFYAVSLHHLSSP